MERKKSQVKNEKPEVKGEKTDIGLSIRIAILFIFHLVGLVGYMLPDYRFVFQAITPFHLILISTVLFFDRSVLNKSFVVFFLLAFLIGFGSEVFGVKSGLFFGYYEYTDWLGFKLLDVPVVIGLLWAATAYACNQVAIKLFPHSKIVAMIIAALLMVLFDYMIEPFAISANLWVWHLSVIPAFNYLSWFIVGFILSLIYSYTIKNSENQASAYFLVSQVLFFLAYQLLNGQFTLTPFD